jgi:chemotaxis family two-component system sensor kinase Cph1
MMSSTMTPPGRSVAQADLTDCDREPIHIPGSIQPHGVLLALDPASMTIVQLAGDTESLLGRTHQELIGTPLDANVGAAALAKVETLIREAQLLPRPFYVIEALFCGRPLEMSAHLSGGLVVLEMEVNAQNDGFDAVQAVQAFSARAGSVATEPALFDLIVAEVGKVTGFDRVVLYRFREGGSGRVVAEHRRSERVESLLDMHYPATDIPVQARQLYCNNWIRTIPNVRYRPEPLDPTDNPVTGRPLDLSFSALRSVSPIHLEYLVNMGVTASMSLSILVGGQLWGVVACHHTAPLYLAARTRAALELFAQIASLQIGRRLDLARSIAQLRARNVHAELVRAMTDAGFAGLLGGKTNLLDLIEAAGVAFQIDGQLTVFGTTPSLPDIKALTEWLSQFIAGGVFSTDCLSEHYSPAAGFLDTGAGLMALSVSRTRRDYVLWFLPELVSTVTWAGDPTEKAVHGPQGGVTPRKSFAAWTEKVRGCSRPWTAIEIESAAELRMAILDVALKHQIARRAAELEAANRELEDFAYVASHDLKAPLRVIDNVSHWLEEDLAAHLDDDARDSMRMLRERVKRMEKMLDDLLQYSRVGRTSEASSDGMVSGTDMVSDILALLSPSGDIKVTVGPGFSSIRLPRMPVQQILMNLISNALKHHHRKQGRVEVTVEDRGDVYAFAVKDDGPGIPAKYHDEIFKIFRTLKPRDQIEGSGMGLAIVRKHIEIAGGSIWLDSPEGGGSIFHFTWPKPRPRAAAEDHGRQAKPDEAIRQPS